MKKKLKAISAELKKASKTHAGQAAKIDKIIKPKMSKLHKSTRRSMSPKMSMKPMLSMKKPKKGDGKFGKVAGKVGGALGLVGQALGVVNQIKELKKKTPSSKAPDKAKVAGRVQKPYLSKKKSTVKKKEVFERQEYPIKSGRFKGLDESEYKAKIRKLRKMKAERDASLKKPKKSKKKKEIAKYNISGFVSKHTGLKPGRYEKSVIMNGVRNAAPSRRKQVLEKLKTNAGTAAMVKKPKLSKKKK